MDRSKYLDTIKGNIEKAGKEMTPHRVRHRTLIPSLHYLPRVLIVILSVMESELYNRPALLPIPLFKSISYDENCFPIDWWFDLDLRRGVDSWSRVQPRCIAQPANG